MNVARPRLGKGGWSIVGGAAALAVLVSVSAYAAGGQPPAETAETDAISVQTQRNATPTPTPTPVTEVTTVDVDTAIPFAATTVDDPARDVGTSAVTTAGRDGVKTSTYSVTLVDGTETGRTLVSEAVTTPPVDQVTSVGSRQPAPAAPPAPPAAEAQGGCDPNYAGACVPIASDVDCAGGSGNGPAYVRGPVQVVGTDIYDLDRDGDGVGCE
ncbi:G5 domain protein [Leifsonia aquatica ATCC 14665]|uniref:G5 domain protein n=1 Tax=Leifsonia aquatica ATCC 14665 TaxID=1358026 RepID=U2RSY4_LEIAQ|nr:G5 domain protein [Leifsonia aquatica ATCC 14665]